MTHTHHRIALRDHTVEIIETDECILWPLSPAANGYGYRWLTIDGKRKGILAHRYIYELVNGPIPEGHHIDHLCRIRMCVNPAHLEAVLPFVNHARALEHHVRKTICKHGHDLTTERAVVEVSGRWRCRECLNAKARKYRRENAAKVNAYVRAWRQRRSLDPATSSPDLVVGSTDDLPT